jgi:hypothetical protein
MEPKANDCAGMPGDLISFQAKDSSGTLQNYKGAKILRTLYETRDPVTNQSIFTDHEEIILKRYHNPNWGLFKGESEPSEPSAYPKNPALFRTSRRLVPVAEPQTPLPSGRFENVKPSFSLFGTNTTRNPLSSIGQGRRRTTKQKRSKRRKTFKR